MVSNSNGIITLTYDEINNIEPGVNYIDINGINHIINTSTQNENNIKIQVINSYGELVKINDGRDIILEFEDDIPRKVNNLDVPNGSIIIITTTKPIKSNDKLKNIELSSFGGKNNITIENGKHFIFVGIKQNYQDSNVYYFDSYDNYNTLKDENGNIVDESGITINLSDVKANPLEKLGMNTTSGPLTLNNLIVGNVSQETTIAPKTVSNYGLISESINTNSDISFKVSGNVLTNEYIDAILLDFEAQSQE